MGVDSFPSEMKYLKILIIEDMSFYHSIVSQSLAKFGFVGEVFIAKSLKETELTIKDLYKAGKKIDLIITDFYLPDGLGTEIVKKIRLNKVLSNIPVLMITTDNNSARVIEAFEAGIDNYLFKPIDDQLLLEKLIFIWQKRQKL